MSNIGSLVAEQTRQTEEFKARKSAEREELSKMTDAGITGITQELEAYLHYLDVQADNPCFSTSNVLLAIQHQLYQCAGYFRGVRRRQQPAGAEKRLYHVAMRADHGDGRHRRAGEVHH